MPSRGGDNDGYRSALSVRRVVGVFGRVRSRVPTCFGNDVVWYAGHLSQNSL